VRAGATGTPPEGVDPGARAPEGDLTRIVTLPNVITVVRIACVPLFVALIALENRRGWLAAALLLGGLGATDGVDGFLARRLHQVSTVGKVLDPVADRLLLVVAGVSAIAVGAVPTWVAVAALAREVLVAVGTLLVFAAGGRRIDVRLVGKAGTLFLMFALPLFIAGHAPLGWHRIPEILGWVAVIPGLALAWAAAVAYVPDARRALAERRGREAPAT